LESALPLIRERARDLKDAAHHLDFYFREPPVFDEKSAQKVLTADVGEHLTALAQIFEALPHWEAGALEAAFQAYGTDRDLKMKVYAQPVRVALTGRTASPGLFEVLVVLGKEVSVKRLRDGAARANKA
jgi:glutamyl-tRNA synthetase